MRWLVIVLVAPLVLLAGLVGQPIKPQPVQVVAPTVSVRVPSVPTPTVFVQPDGLLEHLVAIARSWLSPPVPYQWGGCSRRGVDCSCFIELVYAAVGIQVPRTTVTQVAFDRPVDRAELRPGDTVFFDNTCDHATCGPNPTHEGLYLGAGLMIDAGDPVQVEGVFWSKFHSAGRPPGLP